MSTRPTYHPLWSEEDGILASTGTTNKQRPKDSIRTIGIEPTQITAEELNWQLNNISQWIQYLDPFVYNATNTSTPSTIAYRDAYGSFEVNQLYSTAGTGTPPLLVESTTKVNNLNSDLLDGMHATYSSDPSTVLSRDAAGDTAARVFISSAPNGVAPFVTASSTKVNNLNASLLDSKTASKNTDADTVAVRLDDGSLSASGFTAKAAGGTPEVAFISDTNVSYDASITLSASSGVEGGGSLLYEAKDNTFLGDIYVPSGTQAEPAISFNSDKDTGIYQDSAGSIGITSNGSSCGVFNANGWNGGISTVSGCVSISTGTISHGGTIPLPAAGMTNYYCMVSIADSNPNNNTWDLEEGGTGMHYSFTCSVNQSTRLVTSNVVVWNQDITAYETYNCSANYIIIGIK